MKKTTHPEFCITGLGLTTSVGHDHKTACASIRAGLKRPDKLWNYYLPATKPFEDEDDGYVTGHPVLDGDYDNREERMVKLLAMAFDDLKKDGADSILPEGTPLYLALPEKERLAPDDPGFLDLISENTSIPFLEQGFQIFQQGHAGMIMALSHAANAMREGLFSRVFIAATDSLIGFNDLSRFNRLDRLKSSLNPLGFMPGEAASVILLEKTQSALNRNATIKCMVKAFATAMEEKHVLSINPQGGDGLSKAISLVMDQIQENPLIVDTIISDMNGESFRAEEWAMIQARIMNRINGEKNCIFPAICIGDTGAASSGVSFCIAVRAMARGYLSYKTMNPSGIALVLSSSDTETRGAALLSDFKVS